MTLRVVDVVAALRDLNNLEAPGAKKALTQLVPGLSGSEAAKSGTAGATALVPPGPCFALLCPGSPSFIPGT